MLRRLERQVRPEDIDGALAGDRKAMEALVRRLRPVIQAEVGFALLPLTRNEGRDARQETLDLVQDVLVSLLRDDGKVLRRWDPARGSSLDSFVRLIVRRHVAGVVRSKRRNPYAEHPLPGETLDMHRADGPELEHRLEARDRLDRMLDHVRQRLDERGLLLFELLYVDERSIEDACEATGMTRDAVYAWRSRLKRQLEALPGE
jgi:RNA polymerase sigma-70 factor (ECF subfamily)